MPHYLLKLGEDGLIASLKKEFQHATREFAYESDIYSVDSIVCDASPGTLEQCLKAASQLLTILAPGNRLLNLGGGTGQTSQLFRQIGYDAYNLDIAIEYFDERNVWFDLNSREWLPYEDNFFDVVVCQEVIEHIENPWDLMRKINKVLKSEGYLLLTTPNILNLLSKQLFIDKGYFAWFTPECFSYHINPMSFWELQLIANKTGFDVIRLIGSGDYYFKPSATTTAEILNKNECIMLECKKIHDIENKVAHIVKTFF